jgi:RNA polymerase sigma-70 factor (ECF subfamily)
METSASLLDRLRVQPDADAWRRLVDLYTPLIRTWLRRHGLPPQDAADLVQEVLTVVVRRLPDFQRQERTGSFRRHYQKNTLSAEHAEIALKALAAFLKWYANQVTQSA